MYAVNIPQFNHLSMDLNANTPLKIYMLELKCLGGDIQKGDLWKVSGP